MIKYVVYPGYIRSKTDGDTHFIGGDTLIQLYKLPPNECLIHYDLMNPPRRSSFCEKLISLYPRYDGNYTLEDFNA